MSPCFLNFIINEKKKMSQDFFLCLQAILDIMVETLVLEDSFCFLFPPIIVTLFWVNNDKFTKKRQKMLIRINKGPKWERWWIGVQVCQKDVQRAQLWAKQLLALGKKKKKDQAGKSQLGLFPENLYR